MSVTEAKCEPKVLEDKTKNPVVTLCDSIRVKTTVPKDGLLAFNGSFSANQEYSDNCPLIKR